MKINKLILLLILSCSLLSAMKKDDDDRGPKRKSEDFSETKTIVKKIKTSDKEVTEYQSTFYNISPELIEKFIIPYIFEIKSDLSFKEKFKKLVDLALTCKLFYGIVFNKEKDNIEFVRRISNFIHVNPFFISRKFKITLPDWFIKELRSRLIEKYGYTHHDLIKWLENNPDKNIFDLIRNKADDSIIGTLALLNSGIDINHFDKEHTPLTLAAKKCHDDLIELLIYAGADPNLLSKKSKYAALVLEADRGCKLQDNVRLLLEAGADPNIQNKQGDTALIRKLNGFYSNNSKVNLCKCNDRVKSLINAGADVNIANNKGETPLIEAIKKNNLKSVKKLVSIGAEIDKADEDGKTPLGYAVKDMYISSRLNVDIVNFLISKGAKIDSIDKDGSTLLHYPSDLLYSYRIDLHSWYGKEKGYKSIINTLIDAGISINAKNKHGLTPLMSVVKKQTWAKCSMIEFVRKLLKNGADVNLTDNEGKTALMHTSKSKDIINLLLENGADVNLIDNEGKTALMLILMDGNASMNSANSSYEEIINLLISYGAEIDKPCNNGKTALMYLADTRYYVSEKYYVSNLAFKALINMGANINLCDNEGKTALMYVASDPDCNDDRAEALLEKKADLNLKDNTGKTALMYAAASGKVELVKMLISAEANLDLKDNEGKTAADYATKEKIKILLSSETYRLLFLN